MGNLIICRTISHSSLGLAVDSAFDTARPGATDQNWYQTCPPSTTLASHDSSAAVMSSDGIHQTHPGSGTTRRENPFTEEMRTSVL